MSRAQSALVAEARQVCSAAAWQACERGFALAERSVPAPLTCMPSTVFLGMAPSAGAEALLWRPGGNSYVATSWGEYSSLTLHFLGRNTCKFLRRNFLGGNAMTRASTRQKARVDSHRHHLLTLFGACRFRGRFVGARVSAPRGALGRCRAAKGRLADRFPVFYGSELTYPSLLGPTTRPTRARDPLLK